MKQTKKFPHPDGYTVTISSGNSKMGEIPSVSLPRGITCPENVPCRNKCYMRMISTRPTVRNTYEENLRCLREFPEWFWFAIELNCKKALFFRWHVCGDIPSEEYFRNMIQVAEHTPNCKHLVYTKNYSDVNTVLDQETLPDNLTVVFSIWKDYPCDNRHNLPEAWVDFGEELPERVVKNGIQCRHNCTECNMIGKSCWFLQRGESVILHPTGENRPEEDEMQIILNLFERWRK